MNPVYKISVLPQTKISISQGNSKLGKDIWTFNLLPGDEPLKTKDKLLVNIRGTCHGCCQDCKEACYAINDTKRYHNTVIPAVAKNTLMLRTNLSGTLSQVKQTLITNKAKVCRFHSSGEFDSYDHLKAVYELAESTPEIQFYFYTKRFDWMQQLLAEKKKLPPNLVCNLSEWHDNLKGYKLEGLNRFVYDDHTDPEVEKLKHCPAVNARGNKTGVTCSQCGLCWKANTGRRIAVHAH